ncbi:hypothetical protein [Methanocella sp. MCL-LM]|uniref:hypothetical protein n=1 Tax=Methanocella sp. MCL-LM TaxID=3412035 RepID=UPI003C72A371
MVDGAINPAAAPVPPMGAPAKNPIVSAIVSLIIPGVGQIINGQMKKGIIFLVGYIVFWIVIFFLAFFGTFFLAIITAPLGGIGGCLCCMGYVLPLLVNLYAAYDAYKTANDINAGILVTDWMS